jgi:taurine dioxygenase
MSEIIINPTSGSIGAEISGVDLSIDLSDTVFSEIRQTFIEHGLIFFRNQELTPEDHLRFAKRWGEININRFFAKVEGYEQIAEVKKDPDQEINIGGAWHTDHSYDQIPAMGSILLARETPKTGGDTLFANMYKAYESLSDGLKGTLERMNACHSSRHVFGAHAGYAEASNQRIGNPELATQDAIHPVIITHPESKRKALYVNPEFTVNFEGWTKEESKPLLNYLTEHSTKSEHITRFNWEPGSIAFWDNRCTWHFALNDYPGEKRLMHRITVEGSALC